MLACCHPRNKGDNSCRHVTRLRRVSPACKKDKINNISQNNIPQYNEYLRESYLGRYYYHHFLLFNYHHHHHQTLNCEGRWSTTDDFATSFFNFSLFSAALWGLPNSRPVHSLMSSHLFLCLPCTLPPFTVPCKMYLGRPDERET